MGPFTIYNAFYDFEWDHTWFLHIIPFLVCLYSLEGLKINKLFLSKERPVHSTGYRLVFNDYEAVVDVAV